MVAIANPISLTEGLCREVRSCRTREDRYRLGANLQHGFREGHIRLKDLDLALLFEGAVPNGREILNSWRGGGMVQESIFGVQESDAVMNSDFHKILLLALSSEVMMQHKTADLLQDVITTTVPTNLERERVPGISGIGDQAEVIREGDPYPLAGVSPEWIDTPTTEKRGFIVNVTKEAIFFNRNGLLVDRCSRVAKWMRLNKEKRCISTFVGVTNNFRYNDKNYNTYTASGLYENLIASNPYVNWKSLDQVRIVRSRQTDPMTGEFLGPVTGGMIFCAPDIAGTVALKVGAKETRTTDGDTVSISNNPENGWRVLSSPYIRSIQGNADDWYVGNPQDAFRYMQNWGITTQTAGGGSEADFTNDIALRFKVSERGVCSVWNPWEMTKCTA